MPATYLQMHKTRDTLENDNDHRDTPENDNDHRTHTCSLLILLRTFSIGLLEGQVCIAADKRHLLE